MQLKRGDKIRIISSDEGAEIIKVVDEFHAIVDTFDGEIEIHSKQIKPYQASDVRKDIDSEITFLEDKKIEKVAKPTVDLFSLNSRKNRFQFELDLHADRLIGDVTTKSNEEILSIQLNRVKTYIEEALELKIQRVYLIHGIGSGRLKSEIDTMLHGIIYVKDFSNNYHPKYGKGATEVKLR